VSAPIADIVFVDVETTGLDPDKDSVIQVGVVRTDYTGTQVKARMCLKVKPSTPVHPRAAAVNGYTPEGWADAVEPAAAALHLAAISQGAEFAGHCVWFDVRFCENLLKKNGVRVPWGRRNIDTQTLVHLMRAQNPAMNGTNLQAALEELGGQRDAVHDAAEDAEWSRRVYAHVMAQYTSEKLAQVG